MRKTVNILALAALVLGASAHADGRNELPSKQQTAEQAAKLGLSEADISKMQKDALGVLMAKPEIRSWGLGLQKNGASPAAHMQTIIQSATSICHVIKLSESKRGQDKPTPKSTWKVCDGKAEFVSDDEADAADKKALLGQALVNGPLQAAVMGVVSAVTKKAPGEYDSDEDGQHKDDDSLKAKKAAGEAEKD